MMKPKVRLFDSVKNIILICFIIIAIPVVYAADCRQTSSGLMPLTQMNNDLYHGKQGGLYPNGNTPPEEFQQASLEIAKKIQPLDNAGKPESVNGKIVFLSIGMSLTSMEFNALKYLIESDPIKNPNLILINGAIPGVSASTVANNESSYWRAVDLTLNNSAISSKQVQIVWLKEFSISNKGFPDDAKELTDLLKTIVQTLKEKYSNLHIIYVSSRSYGGYSDIRASEPSSYNSGFSVKWLIEDQINGDLSINYDISKGIVKAPLLRWGPYLWADGINYREDNHLSWQCSDFSDDGLHPSMSGMMKIAQIFQNFLQTDTTAKIWYVANEFQNETIMPFVFPLPFPTREIIISVIFIIIILVIIWSIWNKRKIKKNDYLDS